MADVLYAEDEFTNRRLIEIHLERFNYDCDLAKDGDQAWDMFLQHEYKLVILDRHMPGLQGDEIAKRIRSVNPNIPLIAITSDDSDVGGLKDAGFTEVFIKPLLGREYINKIISYLKT